jgi:serine/threonine-protein kinase HipA
VENFGLFLNALGISSAAAQRRLREGLTAGTAKRLTAELKRMDRTGMKRFADLVANNIRILLPSFGLALPDGIADRDAYIDRGGGWLMGS